jgi:hypothetical protein
MHFSINALDYLTHLVFRIGQTGLALAAKSSLGGNFLGDNVF